MTFLLLLVLIFTAQTLAFIGGAVVATLHQRQVHSDCVRDVRADLVERLPIWTSAEVDAVLYPEPADEHEEA